VRRSIYIAIGIAVISASWVLSGQLPGGTPQEPASAEEATGNPLAVAPDDARHRVRVADSVATSHVQEITLFGRTEADRVVEIRAETNGRVVDIPTVKGTAVAKSDQLVRLAMNDRKAKLVEAKAQVEYRKFEYSAAQSLAEKKYSAEVTVAGDLAALEAARASQRAIELDIARLRISAPFAGIIENITVEVGDLVQVGNIVAQLVDMDPLVVSIEVSEREIGQVKIGQKAPIEFASGQTRTGNVTYVSRSGSDETRTFRVELSVENQQFDIPQGLTAQVTLLTDEVQAHLISPALLTLNDAGQLGVKIVDDKETALFVPISIIAETKDGVWVDGLPGTVRLITVGQEYVRHGQVVNAIDEDEI